MAKGRGKHALGLGLASLGIVLLVIKVIGQWSDSSADTLRDWVAVAVVFITAFQLLVVGPGLARAAPRRGIPIAPDGHPVLVTLGDGDRMKLGDLGKASFLEGGIREFPSV